VCPDEPPPRQINPNALHSKLLPQRSSDRMLPRALSTDVQKYPASCMIRAMVGRELLRFRRCVPRYDRPSHTEGCPQCGGCIALAGDRLFSAASIPIKSLHLLEEALAFGSVFNTD
jgi:hypothetical protein